MKFSAMALGFGLILSVTARAEGVKSAATPVDAAAIAEKPLITLDELKQVVAAKSATIIDANGADMYADGHVPGAQSYAEHKTDLASILPKDKNSLVVAYCGGPMCSAWESPAAEATKLGYTNIKHFKGGINGWKDAGLATEKTAKKSS